MKCLNCGSNDDDSLEYYDCDYCGGFDIHCTKCDHWEGHT